MKTNLLIASRALLAGALCSWSTLSWSQQVVTTTSYGTITRVSPTESVVIRTESVPEPLTYAVTRETTWVDEGGAPIVVENIAPGVPATIYYTRVGDRMVAARVVVKNVAATTIVEPQPPPPGPTTITETPVPAVPRVVPVPVTVPVPVPERVPVPVPVPVPAATSTTTTTTTTTTAPIPGTIAEYVPGQTLMLRSETTAHPIPYVITRETAFVDDAGAPVVVESIARGVPVTVHYVRDGDRVIASRVVVTRPTTTIIKERKLTEDEKDDLEDKLEEEAERARERREKRRDRDD